MDKLQYRFKQEAGSPVLDLYIYSDVCADYYDLDENWQFKRVKSETSADYFRRQLQSHQGITQINLYINSMGGSVVEGYGIYSQLKRHPAQKTAHIDGFACSIASIIACAADHVIAYPSSMMMIHEMANFVEGNADQLREAADALDKIMEGNRQVYLLKSGGKLTDDALSAMLKAETWLTAQDCLALGLVDEIKEQGGMSGQDAAGLLQRANHSLKEELARRMTLLQMARTAEADKPPSAPREPDPPAETDPPAEADSPAEPAQPDPGEGEPPPTQNLQQTATLASLFARIGK